MKKYKGFHTIIAFCVVICMLATTVFAQTEPSVLEETVQADASVYGCFSMDATEAFLGDKQLVKNAKSVFLYELNTQTLMYAWEADQALIPSSFVKILTAIVAIENGALDSAVTVSESAVSDLPLGAVSAKLQVSEVLTLQDLLYCMMVGSANDAATVIAEHISGSEYEFTKLMNEYASRIGCTGSHFVNAHGLEDESQYTTARDTAKILAYAMQNETFRNIFEAKEYTVPATNKSAERNLITGNYMMSTHEVQIYFDERVAGGRTGVANDGARSLATIARSGQMELLCVVMGAASVYEESGNKIRSFGGYNETKTMLDSGFEGYTAAQILYDGQALTYFEIGNGDSLLSVGPHATLSTVLPVKLDRTELTFRYSDEIRKLTAPIRAGDRVCNVEIWYKDLCLAVTDLYAMNDVRDSSAISADAPKQTSIAGWIVALCILIVLGFGGYYFLRTPKGKRFLFKIRRRIRKRNKPKRSK